MVGSDRRTRSRWSEIAAAGTAVVLAALLAACTPSGSSGAAAVPNGATGSGITGSTGPIGSAGGPAAPSSRVGPSDSPAAAPTKTSLTVKASATAIRQGASVTLRFALLAGGAPVGGAAVSVAHAGATTDAVLDATGAGSLVLDALPAGRQELRVSYPGDAAHAASADSVVVTVAALTTITLTASPTTIAPGSPATVEISLTSDGHPISGAILTVTRGQTSVKAPATDSSGKATLSLTGLPDGKNTVTATYIGDVLHTPATGTLALTVHADSAIAVTASDLHPVAGDPVTIGWTVTSAGRPVAGAPVTVDAGGTTTTVTSGKDGKGATELTKLAPGTVPVTVAYAGDAGHGAVTGSVTLSVIGATTVDVSASDTSIGLDDDVTISFRVTSSSGAVGGTATVGFGGKTRQVALDHSGRGSVTIPAGALSAGMHTVDVDYSGSGSYAASSGSVDVSVAENSSCPAWAKACVDLTNSVSWLQSHGKIIYGPVPISSGRPGYRTPSGSYDVYWKDKNHHSSLFNNAPMPNSVFFNGGIAFHEGDPGVMSHGCIHLTWSASQEYWDYLGYGDSVVVFGSAPY